MAANTPIPVIDLFAGPGGLGEGFSSARVRSKPGCYLALSGEYGSHSLRAIGRIPRFRCLAQPSQMTAPPSCPSESRELHATVRATSRGATGPG